MTADAVLSQRVEALFRKSLERDLRSVVTFGPILAEVQRHDGSEPAIRVTIVYEGQAGETDRRTEAVARAASEKARGELGTEIHAHLDLRLRGGVPKLPEIAPKPESTDRVRSWRCWKGSVLQLQKW